MVIEENTATVNGRDLNISTKHSIEICNFIRGKNLLKSKAFLEMVIAKKKAVPFKRYKGDVGHKPGRTGPGRYPEKASKVILGLLESLEVNAQNKGLDTAALYLKEVVPNRAAGVWHYGRQRRRKMKLSHIFLLAEEAVKKEEKKAKKEEAKEPKKEEVKEVKKVKEEKPKKEEVKEVKKVKEEKPKKSEIKEKKPEVKK